MQIAQELSGYTLGGADLLRRAMGKKIQSEMDQQRQVFVEGAVAKGVPEAKASEIFDQVNKFAGYGFNKSHAAAYALVAYQTAYMKANYPVEFLAASMTLDMGNTDKLNVFRRELQVIGVPLLPPDINASDVMFSVERGAGKAGIRYALAAVKNVGGAAMTGLVDERRANGRFADLADFVNRLDTHLINKRQIENLARSGAFESLEPNRRRVFDNVDMIMRHAQAAQNDRESDQIGLFGGDDGPSVTLNLPETADWPVMERLREECDALGLYLSAHPIDAYGNRLKQLRVETAAEARARPEARPVTLAGTVESKKERTSAKGNRYAFVALSDASGAFEVTVFSEVLSAARDFLEVGNSLLVKATAQPDDYDGVKFLANEFVPLEAAAARTVENLRINIGSPDAVPAIRDILADEPTGAGRIRIHAEPDDCAWQADVELDRRYSLSPDAHMALRNIPGVLGVETFELA